MSNFSPLTLPNMTVELRVRDAPEDAHGVPAPDTSDENMCNQLRLATILNHEAKSGPAWGLATTDILSETCKLTIKPTRDEIMIYTSRIAKFNSWRDLCKWIIDDMCSEYFTILLKYLVNENVPHKQNLGFINGHGVGYTNTYIDRLNVTLQQAFDAKYNYKVKRPLVYSLEHNNVDLSRIANAIHPGHWSYPAGHGTKFFTALEVINDVFNLTPELYRALFIVTHVCAQGRSGNLIHYPMDNDAGGYLTTLPEFQV